MGVQKYPQFGNVMRSINQGNARAIKSVHIELKGAELLLKYTKEARIKSRQR